MLADDVTGPAESAEMTTPGQKISSGPLRPGARARCFEPTGFRGSVRRHCIQRGCNKQAATRARSSNDSLRWTADMPDPRHGVRLLELASVVIGRLNYQPLADMGADINSSICSSGMRGIGMFAWTLPAKKPAFQSARYDKASGVQTLTAASTAWMAGWEVATDALQPGNRFRIGCRRNRPDAMRVAGLRSSSTGSPQNE